VKYFSKTITTARNFTERPARFGFRSLNQLPLLPLLLISLFLLPDQQARADQAALEVIHQRIEKKFPDVKHLSASAFEEISTDPDNIVVFDVREKSEFEVSHLDGAIQVDPDIRRSTFNQLYGESLSGKTVVFYCSVGRRSSVLADRVSDDLTENGSEEVYSLQYGIFGWHNERRALINESVNTDFVHPYSYRWSKLLERRDMVRYSAK
jgi:rhodanese-related sulfurtransferase